MPSTRLVAIASWRLPKAACESLRSTARWQYYLSTARSGLIGHPFVTYVCVAESCRRTGVASALLDAVEHEYAGKRLFISTESGNHRMLALLDRRGYIPAGDVSGLNDAHSGADERFFFSDV